MPHLYTIPAGEPVARVAAQHLLQRHPADVFARMVVFVPTRRAVQVMRDAFSEVLEGKPALLPRMIPLADIDTQLLTLLGKRAFAVLAKILPAMPTSLQRYLLMEQVALYEKRHGTQVTLNHALKLTEALMALQEACARAGVQVTQEKLRMLYHADMADHWKQSFLFLGILTEHWPEVERERGMTIAACREVLLLHALADALEHEAPDFPVCVIGSTASQPATARLLQVIATMEGGEVILPGLPEAMDAAEWAAIAEGHPLFHLKQFVGEAKVKAFAPFHNSIWLEALAPAEFIPQWSARAKVDATNIRLIPCSQSEEEARVIALLLREGLERPDAHIALVTPDEGLMARVAVHMERYGITLDRLNAGTLASTESGSLWSLLVAAIAAPLRLLQLRELLHHPLLAIDAELLNGLEAGWHGVNRRRAGQLPKHDAGLLSHADYRKLANLVQNISGLTHRKLRASEWVEQLRALLAPWVEQSGQAHEAVEECLEQLAHADGYGPIDIVDFSALLVERFSTKWRDAGLNAHPRIHLLTPVEARLQSFDRVILANMQDAQWPGIRAPNPWLNAAAEAALGLPSELEHISLMAHDVLMLASRGEIFLTYSLQDAGAPTRRSRFLERFVTLMATHGVNEEQLIAHEYLDWARALYTSDKFEPEAQAMPRPLITQRPRRIKVTDLDKLFTDPFSIYVRYVLGLKKLDEIDADPAASDFGQLAHKAVEALSTHWTSHARPASEAELVHIANHALRDFSERPNIDLFWRTRLMGGLRYVNGLEVERRRVPMVVKCEEPVEGSLVLDRGETMTLYGRIDRLETSAKGATIIDYKTGDIPSGKAILEGKALQLMGYAMLIRAQQSVDSIEYWQLPKLGDVGERLSVETDGLIEQLEEKLKNALLEMLNEATPFLAHPYDPDPRFGNDYDGINRYDEWAG